MTFLQKSESTQQNMMRRNSLNSSNSSDWSPPSKGGGVMEFGYLNPKALQIVIHHIEKHQGKSQEIFTRLNATWLGNFYERCLKRYAIVRWIVICLWRDLIPIYLNLKANFAIYLFDRKATRWRLLTKLSKFAKERGISSIKLTDAALVETPAPRVYPACDQDYLRSPHEHYLFPEVFVVKISNGKIYGGTNLILLKDEVICHDLYDFDHDYTSEELHGRTLIDPKSKRIRWLLHDKVPERIPVAASFVDACAPNYAHWLTEVLPRIAVFCAEQKFNHIPIVVNDGLHKNIIESLFLVAGQNRDIFALPIGRALLVDSLYVTSVAGYVPFEPRNNKPPSSHGFFSPKTYDILRNRLQFVLDNEPSMEWPEKIFIKRNSKIRRLINSDELEDIAITRGYVIVEPEKLTFSQQVKLFSNVNNIVAPAGAALANIIFCRSDANITILISKQPHAIYWYWQNMAIASHNKINYVFGKPSKSKYFGVHADFYIDSNVFNSVLS